MVRCGALLVAQFNVFCSRGAHGEVIEGTWEPKRLVVLEFESMNQAKAWYYSDEYAELKKLRQSASIGNLVFADGA